MIQPPTTEHQGQLFLDLSSSQKRQFWRGYFHHQGKPSSGIFRDYYIAGRQLRKTDDQFVSVPTASTGHPFIDKKQEKK